MNYFNSLKYIFGLSIIFSMVMLSSCDSLLQPDDEAQGPSLMENFAGESNTMYVIQNSSEINVIPGMSTFISSATEPYTLQEFMLIAPQSATTQDGIKPSKLLAFMQAPEAWQPLNPAETVTGDAWYRFSGEEFFSENWDFENPHQLSDLDIFIYNGGHNISELFGDVDIAENKITVGQEYESDGHMIIAAPSDVFMNVNYEITSDLNSVINQPELTIGIPTSGPLDTLGGMFLDPEVFQIMPDSVLVTAPDSIEAAVVVRGEQFFPGLVYTPSTVSIFTAPMNEIFQGELPQPYFDSETRLVLFASDYFVEPPNPQFSVIEPGEELNVENTVVMIPNSVMDIELGLSILPSVPQITVLGENNESFFPEDYAHPPEFDFPDEFSTPGSGSTFIRPGIRYDQVTIENLASEISLDDEVIRPGIAWGVQQNNDILGDGMNHYEPEFSE